MTSSVSICENVKAGVLSVPTRAIKTDTTTRQRYVQVLDANGAIVNKNITAGLAGDTNTEITGGELKEGDKVVLSTTPTNRSTGANAGGFPGGGGGGGGGGLRIGG
jgi:multidrug efflux pump subunit AcrA (membrane-fusion protein)